MGLLLGIVVAAIFLWMVGMTTFVILPSGSGRTARTARRGWHSVPVKISLSLEARHLYMIRRSTGQHLYSGGIYRFLVDSFLQTA